MHGDDVVHDPEVRDPFSLFPFSKVPATKYWVSFFKKLKAEQPNPRHIALAHTLFKKVEYTVKISYQPGTEVTEVP